MTGDLANIVFRLRSVLPKRWFSDQSPNLEAILTSIATPWVWLYGLIGYVVMQTRITTATDKWLDLIAADYFGPKLVRKIGEGDSAFRSRIQANLLREGATRSAVTLGLQSITGVQPSIFEPANSADTGSYGTLSGTDEVTDSRLAYSASGGWGSLDLPFQFFVTATRPPTPGVAMLAGYGTGSGAYGEGAISYVDLSLLPGNVTDEDIQATLRGLLPVNTVAWLRII
ncbi:MAG: hypothetical protein P4L90_19935 [Rhodopila sp.]|nr:hypothetical protein [Rhodopila sp.]